MRSRGEQKNDECNLKIWLGLKIYPNVRDTWSKNKFKQWETEPGFFFLILFYKSRVVKVKISCIKKLNSVLTQLNVKVQLEFTNQGTQSRKQN